MEWSGVLESLAFSGIAFLVAATSRVGEPARRESVTYSMSGVRDR
jgi:hypothetical protein